MQPHDVPSLLEAARDAENAGERAKARRLVARAIELEPTSVKALLWYTWLAETPAAAYKAARRAYDLAPDRPATRRALQWATARHERRHAERRSIPAPPVAPLAELPSSLWRLVRTAVTVVALVLLFGVSTFAGVDYRRQQQTAEAAPDPVQVAIERADVARRLGDREMTIRFLTQAHDLAPNDAAISYYLAHEHVARSTEYLEAGNPDAALPHLEAAYELRPEEEPIVREYQALIAYLAGREAHAEQKWDRVIEALLPLYQIDRTYLDTEALLRDAIVVRTEAERELTANARRALHQTRQAQPGRLARTVIEPDAPSSLPGQASTYTGLPPLEPVTNKRIVVDLSEQHMYVYENGGLKWSWVISTGEHERPTVPGEYRVQSKIENARSNVWSLWMPWWLGIYWVGSVENGIHGLPINDSGYQMWGGYLGSRVSYGCIILSTENARALWHWADIGTPVTVQW